MSLYATPLRYPGGKQRLAPFVVELLCANKILGGDYVEPYAGGAGVAIELLLENQVSRVHLNDSSYPVYAFWNSIVTCPEKLCRRIASASLTVEEWKKRREIVRDPTNHAEEEVGFSVFYLNRCNRSGALTGGIIGGLEQTGKWKMDARFSRKELIRRIEAIATKKDAIVLRNWDAEKFIVEYIPSLPRDTFVYCDPPYYEKSSRLYLNRYKPEDHARIAEVIQSQLLHRWIVSYDNAAEILRFYRERRQFVYDLQYSAARVYKGKEIFIFSDDVLVPRSSSLKYIDVALQANARGLRI